MRPPPERLTSARRVALGVAAAVCLASFPACRYWRFIGTADLRWTEDPSVQNGAMHNQPLAEP